MTELELKYQDFKLHAQEMLEDNSEVVEVFLLKSKVSDDWGTLTIDSSDGQSIVENHCSECFEGFYPFRFGETRGFPYKNISIIISPKKFEALMAGQVRLPEILELCDSLAKREIT